MYAYRFIACVLRILLKFLRGGGTLTSAVQVSCNYLSYTTEGDFSSMKSAGKEKERKRETKRDEHDRIDTGGFGAPPFTDWR